MRYTSRLVFAKIVFQAITARLLHQIVNIRVSLVAAQRLLLLLHVRDEACLLNPFFETRQTSDHVVVGIFFVALALLEDVG